MDRVEQRNSHVAQTLGTTAFRYLALGLAANIPDLGLAMFTGGVLEAFSLISEHRHSFTQGAGLMVLGAIFELTAFYSLHNPESVVNNLVCWSVLVAAIVVDFVVGISQANKQDAAENTTPPRKRFITRKKPANPE